MVELTTLQLVQLGVRFATRVSTNQEVKGPPDTPPGSLLDPKRVQLC